MKLNSAAKHDADFFTGLGYWTRANPEQCLLATRGKPLRRAKDVRRLATDKPTYPCVPTPARRNSFCANAVGRLRLVLQVVPTARPKVPMRRRIKRDPKIQIAKSHP